MYSMRDSMFSIPGSGGKITGSWDLENHIAHDSYFGLYPELLQSDWDRLCKCGRSERLVESPTGETYFVKWYMQRCSTSGMALTERFLVFKVFKNEMTVHTTDIGDLCIFLC
ncbi:unnamed protein product [Microthlaspi erraticum]|uniref:Uncharacterized protein n=1 Tax=Microthlaspi erraticum TaxID=1685480 RepID=A0A6D2KY92_9BRAS|nr:unnamed protein product [Microthlaspi erraticum]